MNEDRKIPEDREIVDLFFGRDETAISETDRKYGKLALRTAENFLHDAEDSRECQNDAYLALWNAIPPERPSDLRAYLIRTVRNLAIDRIRTRSRQKRVPSEYLTSLEELGECVSGNDAEFDALLLRRAIRSFVRSLPDRQKSVFVRRYYCCDGFPEIAADLGVSTSTVVKELAKIRTALKTHLEKEGLPL